MGVHTTKTYLMVLQQNNIFQFGPSTKTLEPSDCLQLFLFDFQAATALIHDSVVLYAKAVDQLLKSHELQPHPLSCNRNENWQHGYSIINYMRVVREAVIKSYP